MSSKKKVLLMGKSGSGKTSMRSIIFANYLARDTMRLAITLEVEHSHVRFLGDLVLNLWDCGGQDVFYENYFDSQRDHIFRSVQLLIYVFDIESQDIDKDLDQFQGCVEAIEENSEDAAVFVLIHKMDLVPLEEREQAFLDREALIKERCGNLSNTMFFPTSIWDESLYKAWSSIVYSLIPDMERLEAQLGSFCDICEADEVVLFERATFLVISHVTRNPHADIHRFEKMSNIIKQFKLSCSKTQAQLSGIEIRNSRFTAFVDDFTSNTYVMLIMSNPGIHRAVTQMNIRAAQKHFEQFIRSANEDTSNSGY